MSDEIKRVEDEAVKAESSTDLSNSALDEVAGGAGSYTQMSNIVKTKHDTVKNSISNIH